MYKRQVDERALHELYLRAFEIAVKEAKPSTVMCSYNRINGVYSADNRQLLTEILREKWGFDGLVMSDWGAVNDRAEGIRAGLDLEMPGNGGAKDVYKRQILPLALSALTIPTLFSGLTRAKTLSPVIRFASSSSLIASSSSPVMH